MEIARLLQPAVGDNISSQVSLAGVRHDISETTVEPPAQPSGAVEQKCQSESSRLGTILLSPHVPNPADLVSLIENIVNSIIRERAIGTEQILGESETRHIRRPTASPSVDLFYESHSFFEPADDPQYIEESESNEISRRQARSSTQNEGETGSSMIDEDESDTFIVPHKQPSREGKGEFGKCSRKDRKNEYESRRRSKNSFFRKGIVKMEKQYGFEVFIALKRDTKVWKYTSCDESRTWPPKEKDLKMTRSGDGKNANEYEINFGQCPADEELSQDAFALTGQESHDLTLAPLLPALTASETFDFGLDGTENLWSRVEGHTEEQYGQQDDEQEENEEKDQSTESLRSCPDMWPDLDSIVQKVVSPTEIYHRLESRAPDTTSCARLKLLTRFFFHYGGPDAFAQIAEALSAFYHTREIDDTATIRGRVLALNKIDLLGPIERRACLVGLCEDRFERQETWAHQRPSRQSERACRRRLHRQAHGRKVRNRADVVASHGMLASAFPELNPQGTEYGVYLKRLQDKLGEGTNWFKVHKRCPSFIWMLPHNKGLEK